MGSLLVRHLLSSCLQWRFKILWSSVYQLVCLVALLCLVFLIGARVSAQSVIQVLQFLMRSRLLEGSGWLVAREHVHSVSDILFQLRRGGGAGFPAVLCTSPLYSFAFVFFCLYSLHSLSVTQKHLQRKVFKEME